MPRIMSIIPTISDSNKAKGTLNNKKTIKVEVVKNKVNNN
jgi:hypothetical protein